MLYRCSTETLGALKITDPKALPGEYDSLFSWLVFYSKRRGKDLLVVLHEATRLRFEFSGLTDDELGRFDEILKTEIRDTLEGRGVSADLIQQYLYDAGQAYFVESEDSEQIASHSEVAVSFGDLARMYLDEQSLQWFSRDDQNKYVDDRAYYLFPKGAIKNLLERAYGYNWAVYDLAEIAGHMFTDDAGMLTDSHLFLNKYEGTLFYLDYGTDLYEWMSCSGENIQVPSERFDFHYHFRRFSADIDNAEFHRQVKERGRGRGSARRITDLMRRYPAILESWYEYKNNYQEGRARAWLMSEGLM